VTEIAVFFIPSYTAPLKMALLRLKHVEESSYMTNDYLLLMMQFVGSKY